MNLHFFDLGTVPKTPWKNGGGLTQEIVCVPAGAGIADFDWRISVAQVSANGPFSRFHGIDRVIMLLQGQGMTLEGQDHQHALVQPLLPHAFAGEVAIACTLIDGPTTDLNVMVRRHVFRAEISVLTDGAELPLSADGMLFATDGLWQMTSIAGSGQTGQNPAQPLQLGSGQGVWWHGPDQKFPVDRQAQAQLPRNSSRARWTMIPLKAGHLVWVQIHRASGLNS